MKIAVISDIHGNLPALEAVLSEIKNEGMDRVIFLGDLITDFAQHTSEVLRAVRAVSTDVIRGNLEGYIVDYIDDPDDDSWERYAQFCTNLQTLRQLSDEDLAYIRALPRQLSIRIDERLSLRAVHGSPFSEFDGIMADDDEMIAKSLAATEEDILLCGHTHRPFLRIVNGKAVINAGSAGISLNGNPAACYAVIQYEDGAVRADIRAVEYDYDALKSGCDLSIPWIRLCLKNVESGVCYVERFLEEAEQRCGVWPIPNDVWSGLFDEWLEKGIV